MNRRASVDERGFSRALVELERVFDWRVLVVRTPMRKHVGTDFRQRDLKVHEIAVILAATACLTQASNGFMKRFQSFIYVAERCMELKGSE